MLIEPFPDPHIVHKASTVCLKTVDLEDLFLSAAAAAAVAAAAAAAAACRGFFIRDMGHVCKHTTSISTRYRNLQQLLTTQSKSTHTCIRIFCDKKLFFSQQNDSRVIKAADLQNILEHH